ncbi:MAG: T9SS type A sorting domain-containing protein [Chitinophagales bacterium]|nr:T9SS type A sorting domain-containing protein [Chitinophagales bacterium]
MKKSIYLLFTLLFAVSITKAQTTALDFTMSDCNGEVHNLFSTLDENKVVIMEFFMLNCNSCVTAGDKLKIMYEDLLTEFPDDVLFYHIAYNNSITCASVLDFVSTNEYNSVPFDSGTVQVAYYGGFGMPSIAVVAGSTHEVLFTHVGFTTSDTTKISDAIHEFFLANPTGVNNVSPELTTSGIFPNPANDQLNVSFNLKESAALSIQLLSISGQHVSIISNEQVPAGGFHKTINTAGLFPGMYLLKTIVNGVASYNKVCIAH